jgi:hypothetical protein
MEFEMSFVEEEVSFMKISSLMHSFSPDFEERKRSLQRKEVGEVYKKHAKYADASKNPMLLALENLLSGKTEKDLHEADAAARNESQQFFVETNAQSDLKSEIEPLKQNDQEVAIQENLMKVFDGGTSAGALGNITVQDNTIALLEKVHQAALAPTQPSPQDFRVAASASEQIKQVLAEQNGESIEEADELPPYAQEELTFTMPERFEKDFARNAEQQTIFGQELEKRLFQRTFNQAAAKYNAHISMVKNGYRSADEPTFSQIA